MWCDEGVGLGDVLVDQMKGLCCVFQEVVIVCLLHLNQNFHFCTSARRSLV